MADEVRLYHNLHVNSTYSSFIRAFGEMLGEEWFDRSQNIIISTYSKAVERERNRRENASENYTPCYPYITIDPMLDFEPDERAGMFYYQYKNYMNHFGAQQWNDRIYDDGNVYLAPVYNRYRGTLEVIIWASSVYELIDYRTRVFQFWGGLDRIIQPTMEGYFILPESLRLYKYKNDYTEEEYTLDWDKSLASTHLIRNINKNRLVYPFAANPMYKLVGVSDGSDRYGSGSEDAISEHRLDISVEFEAWLPVHIGLVASGLPTPCKYFELDLDVDYKWSPASAQAGSVITTPEHRLVTYMNTSDSTALETVQLRWKRSFSYELTNLDIAKFATDQNIEITLPEKMDDCVYINVLTRYGQLQRDFTWVLINSTTVKIYGRQMENYADNDLIVFELYELDGG